MDVNFVEARSLSDTVVPLNQRVESTNNGRKSMSEIPSRLDVHSWRNKGLLFGGQAWTQVISRSYIFMTSS